MRRLNTVTLCDLVGSVNLPLSTVSQTPLSLHQAVILAQPKSQYLRIKRRYRFRKLTLKIQLVDSPFVDQQRHSKDDVSPLNIQPP